MTLQIRRVTGVTPDPTKIGGTITYMIVLNQALSMKQIIGIEKIGNEFQVMYIHDTNNERYNEQQQPIMSYYGLVFKDENQDILFNPNPDLVGSQYIGKFDLSGNPKHVFVVI